jgi:kynurenine formamidase
MRALIGGISAAILVGAVGDAVAPSQRTGDQGLSAQEAASRPVVTKEQYDRWQKELSNWGRWGPNDQDGAINLITPEKRQQVMALAKEGFTVSLSSDVPTRKNDVAPCPAQWEMVSLSSDRIAFPCIHGAGLTHLDGFAHVYIDNKMFNGHPVEGNVTMEGGATKGSIHNRRNGVVTRAVLYDIPRLKGLPYLEPGTRVFVEDLEAWERTVGVKVGPGDALLFRGGRWAREAKLGPYPLGKEMAGLDNSVIPWLRKRDVAVIGWETPGYAPAPPGDLPGFPVHNFALAVLGMQVLDRADFDAAAEAAAARNRWEFLLVIAPLRIRNGTGSPVNPLAIF